MATEATLGTGKARAQVFTKELALCTGLRQHFAFTIWEPTFGGKFPRQKYDTIIQEVQNILNYLGLISYASNILHNDDEDDHGQESWLKTFAQLVRSINVTLQELTSTLALLSVSVTNGSPLPPYLRAPEPYRLSAKLEAIDADILHVSHNTELRYAAFAVMQIASSLISDEIGKLIERVHGSKERMDGLTYCSNVRSLLGEVDISFPVLSTSEESLNTKAGSKGKID
ncbi:MAG: hypothetical protein Q9166_007131 [cf. Caloplaca sp. 2 TL-2023]